jgi:hypothetical protein
MKKEIKKLKVSGTYEEMAYQQGQWAKAYFDDMLRDLANIPQVSVRIPLPVLKSVLWFFGKRFGKDHFGHNQMSKDRFKQFQSLANGLDVNLSTLYGGQSFEILSCNLPFQLGCTSFSTKLDNDDYVLAYNHDFPNFFSSYLTLREREPSDGFKSLNVTYPPLLGAIAGVNEKGLAVSLNHAFESAPKKQKSGQIITFLVQDCLDRFSTVDECVEYLKTQKVPNGSMMTLVDETGQQVCAELSSQKITFRESVDGNLITFNRYQNQEMKPFEIPGDALGKYFIKGVELHAHNDSREKRWEEIFEKEKSYSFDGVRNLMSDHGANDEPSALTICRHDEAFGDTVMSAFLFPKERKIMMSAGTTCQAEYEEFVL